MTPLDGPWSFVMPTTLQPCMRLPAALVKDYITRTSRPASIKTAALKARDTAGRALRPVHLIGMLLSYGRLLGGDYVVKYYRSARLINELLSNPKIKCDIEDTQPVSSLFDSPYSYSHFSAIFTCRIFCQP